MVLFPSSFASHRPFSLLPAPLNFFVLSLYIASPLFLGFVRSDSVFISSSDYTAGVYGAGPYQTYFTSNATPVAFNFVEPLNRSTNSLSSGYLFTSPRGTSTAQPSASIFDSDGHLIWDGSAWGETLVFQVETYLGEPHILVWSGTTLGNGVGSGYLNLLNSKYQRVARYTTNLTGITGSTYADFHEARITTNNTGLMTAYYIRDFDLSPYGGPSSGYLFDSVFQELNITSGEPLFTWYASDHVDPSECYDAIGTGGGSTDEAWDYFHINSIEQTDDGNYLISSRHCFTVYYLNGTDGEILWKMGGANSSFAMGDGANYSWQHHARWVTKNDSYATMTLFDNAGEYGEYDESSSRGLYLALNFTDMTVELLQDLIPYNYTVSESQGSVQLQPNGNFLVGWGFMPWYSEYSSTGELLWSAQFGVIGGNYNEAYRMLRFNWTGEPTDPPSLQLVQSSSSNLTTVHVSWNGDTRTQKWELIGASDSSGSDAISLYNQSRSGFETTFTFNTAVNSYGFYAVRALSSSNTHLGITTFTTSTENGVVSMLIGAWRAVAVVAVIIYSLQVI
ncbi:ASST-domain-containing protein [Lentinula aciculospora]|uniref:ASST-domain-containing protein n=1 Tax=Lentinula aciculospora TaxID=153920 RepID=A0A9W9A3S9_9AGAR|nr:ASST-domain-containing protein [Lentinula aciculospora]